VVNSRDPGPHLRRRLGYLLKHALLELDRLHEELLAPAGIGARELAVLLLLDGREPESQQQAAQRLGVDRTTMVALLDALEDKGLVTRRPDLVDRRRNVVVLTDTGRATLRQATSASDEAERRLLAVLNDDEAALLRSLLTRLDTAATSPSRPATPASSGETMGGGQR
jgi:DNA-binding MarR family transcriptional regulator